MIESPDIPAEIDNFNMCCYMESVALPICQIGHGNSDVTGKYEAVFSAAKLDVARVELQSMFSLFCQGFHILICTTNLMLLIAMRMINGTKCDMIMTDIVFHATNISHCCSIFVKCRALS